MSVTVEHRGRRCRSDPSPSVVRDGSAKPGYASKPGDARRQGHADGVARPRGLAHLTIEFIERSGQIEARLGVVAVATINPDPDNRHGFCWAVFLPGYSHAPRPARDAEAAKRAVEFKLREWCEAAKLISARPSRHA